ncbi:hypothetical protein HA45_20090 [Pantoea rodasii]|nr:hypothetical protein HA45_20090 [Pantoea rodasii]
MERTLPPHKEAILLADEFQVVFTMLLLVIIVIFMRTQAQKIDFQSLIDPAVTQQILLLAQVKLMHPKITKIALFAFTDLRIGNDAVNFPINAS